MTRRTRHGTIVAMALLAVVATLALASTFGLGSCRDARDAGPSATRLAEPDEVIDEHLMLALSQAKNYHHKADVYLGDGKVDEAIAVLKQILAIRFPDNSPEGEDVRHDARARIAKLYLSKGSIDDALAVIDAGLAETTRDSFFVANLHTVRGEVFEAKAARETDPEVAAQHKRQAIVDYDRSIEINEALMDALSGGRR